MECQFEHDLYYKFFSIQLESDKTDTLQQRIEWWIVVVDRGGPISKTVYDYSFAELFTFYREAIGPVMQEMVKLLKNRPIIL